MKKFILIAILVCMASIALTITTFAKGEDIPDPLASSNPYFILKYLNSNPELEEEYLHMVCNEDMGLNIKFYVISDYNNFDEIGVVPPYFSKICMGTYIPTADSYQFSHISHNSYNHKIEEEGGWHWGLSNTGGAGTVTMRSNGTDKYDLLYSSMDVEQFYQIGGKFYKADEYFYNLPGAELIQPVGEYEYDFYPEIILKALKEGTYGLFLRDENGTLIWKDIKNYSLDEYRTITSNYIPYQNKKLYNLTLYDVNKDYAIEVLNNIQINIPVNDEVRIIGLVEGATYNKYIPGFTIRKSENLGQVQIKINDQLLEVMPADVDYVTYQYEKFKPFLIIGNNRLTVTSNDGNVLASVNFTRTDYGEDTMPGQGSNVNQYGSPPKRSDYTDDMWGSISWGFDSVLFYISVPFKMVGVLFSTVVTNIQVAFSQATTLISILGRVFSFLPPEWVQIITTIISIGAIISLIGLFRR